MKYTYALETSIVDRANLDQKASRDGYEDANAHYPDGLLTGEDLETHANSLVNEALENEDLTDDEEEYRSRYVPAYCAEYSKQAASRKHDEE